MHEYAATYRRALIAIATVGVLSTPGASSADFASDLARIDQALMNNPSRVSSMALQSCLDRRRFAERLYNRGDDVRASRSLKYCFQALKVSVNAPPPKVAKPPSQADLQKKATREFERALSLKPNAAKGLEIYRECAACHTPEGFGLIGGTVPQIAGQHRKVVIKQLADIRAGNRDNLVMIPYSSVESIGGAQAVADVAAYIDTLEISVGTGKGAGDDLALGAGLYAENCVSCHGAAGEGNDEEVVPRIQAQHFEYLLRQFEWIRDGKRRNANAEMVAQIQGFGERETRAVLDYVSRLEPSEELQAPAGWKNPDFVD